MFLGTHFPKVDDKGRFFLPAKFRDELGEGLIIAKGGVAGNGYGVAGRAAGFISKKRDVGYAVIIPGTKFQASLLQQAVLARTIGSVDDVQTQVGAAACNVDFAIGAGSCQPES